MFARNSTTEQIGPAADGRLDCPQAQAPPSGMEGLERNHKYVIETDDSATRRKEVYRITDEAGNTLGLAEREGEFCKGMALIGFLFILSFAILLLVNLEVPSPFINVPLLALCLLALVLLGRVVLKPRPLRVYQLVNARILPILQIKRYRRITSTYAIESADGDLLGYLRSQGRPWFRAKLKCHGPDGSLLCTLVERVTTLTVFQIIMEILSGLAGPGPGGHGAYELDVVEPTASRTIGKFNGKTIDVSPDARIDGRLCLAMGLIIRSTMQ